jgi:hypothetical protein
MINRAAQTKGRQEVERNNIYCQEQSDALRVYAYIHMYYVLCTEEQGFGGEGLNQTP